MSYGARPAGVHRRAGAENVVIDLDVPEAERLDLTDVCAHRVRVGGQLRLRVDDSCLHGFTSESRAPEPAGRALVSRSWSGVLPDAKGVPRCARTSASVVGMGAFAVHTGGALLSGYGDHVSSTPTSDRDGAYLHVVPRRL